MADPTSDSIKPESLPPAQPLPAKEVPKVYDLNLPILTLANNITVRHYRYSDAESMSEHAKDPAIARVMSVRWPSPYDLDASYGWIAMNRNEENWRRIGPAQPFTANPAKGTTSGTVGTGQLLPTSWAICRDDKLIGSMGFDFQSGTLACTLPFGYWIGPQFWRQGIMSVVLPAMIDWVWDNYPWIVKLQPNVYSWNPASARLLQRCGFEQEGRLKNAIVRLGCWSDILVFGMLRPESKRKGETQKRLSEAGGSKEPPEVDVNEHGKLMDPGVVFDD